VPTDTAFKSSEFIMQGVGIMTKHVTFGNARLSEKMVTRFGSSHNTVEAEMRYSKEVQDFVRKVESASKEAKNSKLIFG
jgi:hypothetical protein